MWNRADEIGGARALGWIRKMLMLVIPLIWLAVTTLVVTACQMASAGEKAFRRPPRRLSRP